MGFLSIGKGATSATDPLATSANPILRELGGVLAVLADWLEIEGFPATPDPADILRAARDDTFSPTRKRGKQATTEDVY